MSASPVVQRWPSSGKGRSLAVAYGQLIWTVANARDASADFETQVTQSFDMLETHLQNAGSARTHLLSIQVMLSSIKNRDSFDRLWQQWIGPDAQHWPQRACVECGLAPGLMVELVVVAARSDTAQAVME